MMRIKISKNWEGFVVDPVSEPGNPPVGRGATMLEAMGDFLHHYQAKLGVQIEVDASAQEAELQRRSTASLQR